MDQKLEALINAIERINPAIYVKLGISHDNSIFTVAKQLPGCLFYSIDLFRQVGAYLPLEEFHFRLKESGVKNIIPLRAPLEFAVSAIPDDFIDVVQIDARHLNLQEEGVRFTANFWRNKTRRMIIHKEHEHGLIELLPQWQRKDLTDEFACFTKTGIGS